MVHILDNLYDSQRKRTSCNLLTRCLFHTELLGDSVHPGKCKETNK